MKVQFYREEKRIIIRIQITMISDYPKLFLNLL